MPTYSSAVNPTTTGLGLGTAALRWAPFLSNVDISGTLTYSGALSGITTISTSGSITTASQLISTVSTGTIPVVVSSTTKCTNLNADLLDGNDWSAPAALGSVTPAAASFTTLSASGQITSTVSTGSAPFVVASTTQVSNLNASQLVGATWVSPGTIGSSTPSTGAFTTLSGSTSLTVGSGTAITKIQKISASITPTAVTANSTATETFTFTGATTSDSVVSVDYPAASLPAGTGITGARVSALNTVEITFMNTTAGNLTPSAGTWTVTLIRA